MKKLLSGLIICLSHCLFSQTTSDLFKHSDMPVTWLGVDFSHVKLIGNFSEFSDAGIKSTIQIRDRYFPDWNKLVLNEPLKYDLKGMLRKENIYYDLSDVNRLNSKTPLEDMETYNAPVYTQQDISNFISQYTLSGKEGLGVVFIAEVLNKIKTEAYFHFVLVDMKTKQILLTERFRSEPMGFGLRNFWAGAIYRTIKEIRDNRYLGWKRQYTAVEKQQ